MIGQVVEKADCYSPPSSYQNETVFVVGLDHNQSDTTFSPSGGRMTDYTAQCQLGAAVAVTFLVGIYQVSHVISIID